MIAGMLESIKEKINELLRRPFMVGAVVALLIFAIALVAFGVKTLGLGFFHDDWHHLYYSYNYGLTGLMQFLFYDSRPLAYIVYWPLFSLIGYSAFDWHLLVLILRLLAVLTLFGCLNVVWPTQKKSNGLVAALFLVYPVFQAQPNSVSYALHWVGYLAFLLSLLFMLLAVGKPKYRLLFIALSLILEVFHLLMLEYFAGIELARPFLLWFLFKDIPNKERFRKVILIWLPYLVILGAYTVFRASFSELLGYDRNSPVILFGFFSTPLQSLVFLVQSFLQDFANVLLKVWNSAYDPSTLDLSLFTNVWVWGLAVLVGFFSWLIFSLVPDPSTLENEKVKWGKDLLVVGLIFVALGLLPTWLSGRSFSRLNEAFNDRLALPSMFGASMVWVGIVYYLIRKPKHGIILICVLIGLAVGQQLRTNTQYAQAWKKQQQFYWQLFWRAPYIEPGTAFISPGEFLPLMGIHPTSYAINLIYPANPSAVEFNYAFFESDRILNDSLEIPKGGLSDLRFNTSFESPGTDSITLFFLPERNQCLWILRPEDSGIPNLPKLAYATLPISDLDRIQEEPINDQYPSSDLFGPEPEHTWCFFYEKADLARQYQNWESVINLWDEAQEKSFAPRSAVEYVPFIEGFAETGNWERAADLTIASSSNDDAVNPALCDIWATLLSSTAAGSEKDAAWLRLSSQLSCSSFAP